MKLVRIDWIDSMISTSSQTPAEHEVFSQDASDMKQTSLGIITYEGDTHLCLAAMISEEGAVGTAIKIPKFAIISIEELQVKHANNKSKKR